MHKGLTKDQTSKSSMLTRKYGTAEEVAMASAHETFTYIVGPLQWQSDARYLRVLSLLDLCSKNQLERTECTRHNGPYRHIRVGGLWHRDQRNTVRGRKVDRQLFPY